MIEIWKDIDGYIGRYQISNFGRIRSLDKDTVRKDGKPLHTKGKILKIAKDSKGYMRIQIPYRTLKIHREVAKAFLPNPFGLSEVNHIDGNKSNNNVSNLEWISHQDNINHALVSGLYTTRVKQERDNKGRFLKKVR